MIKELNGALMTDRAAAHDHLKCQLELPEYYGKNLDALYDCLTAYGKSAEIVLHNSAMLEEHLGGYGSALIATMQEAAENNPGIVLTVE